MLHLQSYRASKAIKIGGQDVIVLIRYHPKDNLLEQGISIVLVEETGDEAGIWEFVTFEGFNKPHIHPKEL
jgi:hypothetical protein